MENYTIIQGDSLSILKTVPDACVQSCVCSPPYFRLRSYLPDNSPEKSLEIGLETTPQEYVARLVAIFREVYRVLKDDGTCWIVIGDTYVDDERWAGYASGKHQQTLHTEMRPHRATDLPSKSVLGIPWRLAFALQDDGWILRQEIIWEKSNCHPEPVKDRCTKSHEQIFLLSKQPHYLYDINAIREPHQSGSVDVGSTWATRKAQGSPTRYGTDHLTKQSSDWMGKHPLGRNRRSVWRIPTEASPLGHYAVMPRKLAEVCILAGSRPGDVVLDPFAGAGTTLLVAVQHQRQALGIELNQAYITLIQQRLSTIQPHLWDGQQHSQENEKK